MSEKPWCVEHDREAGFVTTDQKRVCWVGLSAGGLAPECRIETATVTIKRVTPSEAWDCVQRAYAILTNEGVNVDRVAGAENELAHALRIARSEATT